MQRTAQDDEDDLLAGFSASAPVDASSHFPPPQSKVAPSRASSQTPSNLPQPSTQLGFDDDDDDDPFGLNEFKSKAVPPPSVSHALTQDDDDDFMGLLGKPVSEFPQRQAQARPREETENGRSRSSRHPADKAVAEIVDMGFPPDKARDALAHTESGVDVQAAIGWLLNQAHAETGSRKQSQEPSRDTSRGRPSRTESPANGQPAWLRGSAATSREDGQSPASRERDPAKVAAEIGSKFYKTAGSFWKTAQKTAQKAMADFQQQEGGDASQPKWMRDAQAQSEADARQAKRAEEDKPTDEAMMLDMPAPERPQRRAQNGHSTPQAGPSTNASMLEVNGSALRSSSTSPAQAFPARPRPPEKITRQLVEEQSAQAYVSANRRRKPPPPEVKQASPAETRNEQPKEPQFASADAMDDFFATPAPAAPRAKASAPGSQRSTGTFTPTTVRPAAKARAVPHTDSSALAASHSHRQKGTEAFKRGDFASAHSHYTAALSPLPAAHPILVIIHCNRALTSLKTGDPKAAISDAEAALAIIGPSRGEGEAVSLASSGAADEAGDKPLKDYFGKALMRKAEAYEHMEKWPDAARAWRDAVEAGVGGAIAIQGRNRCEKAASPARAASAPSSSSATPRARPTPAAKKATPAPRRSAMSDLAGAGQDSEAVQRLRAANVAAAAASDEQFALTDSVNARLDAWKGTKKDNLRALLASMDTVLWADAGWSKVGMSDLVMPNRVKIVYMKAIAKVHPDKVSFLFFLLHFFLQG